MAGTAEIAEGFGGGGLVRGSSTGDSGKLLTAAICISLVAR